MSAANIRLILIAITIIVLQACASPGAKLHSDPNVSTQFCNKLNRADSIEHDEEAAPFDPTADRANDQIIRDHVVRVNRDGVLVDPVLRKFGKRKSVPEGSAQRHIHRILCKAIELAEYKRSVNGTEGDNDTLRVPILVFVHGGLNKLSETDKRLLEDKDDVASIIMCGKDNKYCLANRARSSFSEDSHYPVFISWPSDAFGTLGEHLGQVREGHKTNKLFGALSAPVVFTSDLLTSIARWPSTAWYQGVNEKDRVSSGVWPRKLSGYWKSAIARFCRTDFSVPFSQFVPPSNSQLVNDYTARCRELPIPGVYNTEFDEFKVRANLSIHDFSKSEHLLRAPVSALTGSIRYTVGTLWHSTLSLSAWDNMKRRTVNLFYPPHFYDERFPEDAGQYGGLFFEMLLDYADYYNEHAYENEGRKTPVQFEITLVGHSMGTIILNRTIEYFSARFGSTSHLKNVVYMAAAASIDETLSSIAPVLEEATVNGHPINFYNLTLNRTAEVAERHCAGILPMGSLLVSIDQHYETPEHPLLRTMGSEVNVLTALDTIDLRLRRSAGDLVFKSFDRNPGRPPQEHGDFWSLAFWNPCVWKLDSSNAYSSVLLRNVLPVKIGAEACEVEWQSPKQWSNAGCGNWKIRFP